MSSNQSWVFTCWISPNLANKRSQYISNTSIASTCRRLICIRKYNLNNKFVVDEWLTLYYDHDSPCSPLWWCAPLLSWLSQPCLLQCSLQRTNQKPVLFVSTNQSPVFTCNLLARLESHLCFLFLEKLQSVDGQSQISLQFIVVGARGKHFSLEIFLSSSLKCFKFGEYVCFVWITLLNSISVLTPSFLLASPSDAWQSHCLYHHHPKYLPTPGYLSDLLV